LTMWRDIQFGLRQIGHQKLFSFAICFLLALGIGANTVIFSFVNSLLLKRLPVRSPENLFLLLKVREKQVRPDTSFFYRQYETIVQDKSTFTGLTAEQDWNSGWSGATAPFSTGDSVRLVTTQIVSPNYFSELGIRPLLGRVLEERDAAATSDIPVVLSYRFWNSQFQRDPGILGRPLRLKNYPFVVAGVLPRAFHDIDVEKSPDVRLPISAAPILTGHSVIDPSLRFQIIARLAPGVSPAQAAAAASAQAKPLEEPLWHQWYARRTDLDANSDVAAALEYETNYRVSAADVSRGVSRVREQFSKAVYLLMACVGFLLLAVCANVAGLLLARGEERKREIAVRLSIGAGRARLLRQFVIEHLLLGIPSALAGIGLAYAVAPMILRFLPEPLETIQSTPYLLDVTPDLRVLLFSAGISLLTVFVFGLSSLRIASTLDLNGVLKGAGRAATSSSYSFVTVGVQAALAVLLAVVSGVMLRTFWNLEHLNPGFDRAHVVEFNLDPSSVGYSPSRSEAFSRDLKTRVEGIGGVRAVGFSSHGLMRGIGLKTTVTPHGAVLPKKTFLNTSVNVVSPEYFDALGIPLLAGRTLNPHDEGKKPAPIVINDAFVRFFFPHESALGKVLVQGTDGNKPPSAIVVGIVGTAKYRSLREPDPPIYYELGDEQNTRGVMYVRTSGRPETIVNSVRAAIQRIGPGVPIIGIYTLEQEVQNTLWQERLVSILCAFFGLTSLLVSATGLYGALAYAVARRSREFGIRIAVGARTRHIVEAVCLRMIIAVTIGLVCGLPAAAVFARFGQSLAFDVQAYDPLSFTSAAILLIASGVAAAAWPVWRATRSDAAVVLRAE
jgi:predicted permease